MSSCHLLCRCDIKHNINLYLHSLLRLFTRHLLPENPCLWKSKTTPASLHWCIEFGTANYNTKRKTSKRVNQRVLIQHSLTKDLLAKKFSNKMLHLIMTFSWTDKGWVVVLLMPGHKWSLHVSFLQFTCAPMTSQILHANPRSTLNCHGSALLLGAFIRRRQHWPTLHKDCMQTSIIRIQFVVLSIINE